MFQNFFNSREVRYETLSKFFMIYNGYTNITFYISYTNTNNVSYGTQIVRYYLPSSRRKVLTGDIFSCRVSL